MPQPQQNVNIQKMDSKKANSVVNHIYKGLQYNPVIDQKAQQVLIDAIGHPSFRVAEGAFLTIRRLTDKGPFVSLLLTHAADHSRPVWAVAAYEGMRNTDDFTPFYQVIEKGVQSLNFYISSSAILPILDHAKLNNALDPQLNQAVIYAMEHANFNIVSFALGVIWNLKDKRAFFTSLQQCARSHPQPQLAQAAEDLLNAGGHIQSGVSPDLTGRCGHPQTGSVRNVRLDFNIITNGGGPEVHRNDALSSLCTLFDRSVKDGFVIVKAAVFYDPNNELQDNALLEVKFPEADRDDILAWSAQSIAPEFDLQKEGGAVYAVTLKERPSF